MREREKKCEKARERITPLKRKRQKWVGRMIEMGEKNCFKLFRKVLFTQEKNFRHTRPFKLFSLKDFWAIFSSKTLGHTAASFPIKARMKAEKVSGSNSTKKFAS